MNDLALEHLTTTGPLCEGLVKDTPEAMIAEVRDKWDGYTRDSEWNGGWDKSDPYEYKEWYKEKCKIKRFLDWVSPWTNQNK